MAAKIIGLVVGLLVLAVGVYYLGKRMIRSPEKYTA